MIGCTCTARPPLTTQPGLFTYELPGVGVLRYGLMHNGPELLRLLIPVVLGDPLCHPRNFGAISAAFLQQHPRAMFMQVGAAVVAHVQGAGVRGCRCWARMHA